MTILTSTTATLPFTPSWLEGQPGAPVFHLRAGSTIERGQMNALLDGKLRAARVFDFHLRQVKLDGIRTLFDGDPDFDRLIEIFSADAEEAQKRSKEDAALAEQVEALLTQHWPVYADLVDQAQRRGELAPIVALQRFCTGWENVVDNQDKPVPFALGKDGLVADEALSRIPEFQMKAAGNRAFNLQFGWGEEKNFERPSSSDDGQKTSPEA